MSATLFSMMVSSTNRSDPEDLGFAISDTG
jgi:hypothetical protein